MVGHVERLGSELDRLVFPNLELSRQAHVDLDTSRPSEDAHAGISIQAVNLLMDRFSLEALAFFPIFVLPGILTDILRPRTLARSLFAGLILSVYGFFPGDIVASMTGDPFVQWLLFARF